MTTIGPSEPDMGTCHNCHNIVPRTVDRCPVCGALPLPDDVDNGARDDIAPGWASDAARPRRANLHPDEFLSELLGEASPTADSTPDAADPAPASGVPVPAPPARPTRRWGDGHEEQPDAAPSDHREPVFDFEPSGSPAPPAPPTRPVMPPPPAPEGTVAPPALPPSGPPPGEPRKDPESIQAATRAVLAGSSRIEGDIKVGRSTTHTVKLLAATAFALICLVFGFAAGWASQGESTLAFVDTEEPPATDVVDEAPVTTTPEPPVDLAADNEAANVTLWVGDECLLFATTDGILTGPNTVLVIASALKPDTTPWVVSGTARTESSVVGVSLVNDLAVVRTEEPIGEPLVWGTAGRLTEGSEVTILDHAGSGLTAVPATVAAVHRSQGVIDEIEFAEVDAAPGSAVLDSDGFLIAMVDRTGVKAKTADLIRPVAGRLIARPNNPKPSCPAPAAAPEPQG